MTKVGIIRCEKNMDRCPMTSCFRCLNEKIEGFSDYDDATLVGVFSCHCEGEGKIAVDLSKILKSKGVDVIHFCTCTFAKKKDKRWVMDEGGFCDKIDQIMEDVHQKTGIKLVKGTAHLPEGYTPQVWG